MKSLLLPLSLFLACHPTWTVAAFQPPLSSFTSAAAARSSAIGARNALSRIGEEDVPTTGAEGGRRRALESLLLGSAAVSLCWGTGGVEAARADLDMDAFVNSQLRADTTNCDPKKDPKCKPQLSQDQALCQYGQSGEARAEACKRVKAAGGSLPSASSQGKTLGGAYAL